MRASAGDFYHRLGYPVRVPPPVDRFSLFAGVQFGTEYDSTVCYPAAHTWPLRLSIDPGA